jgi:hypothetical protein
LDPLTLSARGPGVVAVLIGADSTDDKKLIAKMRLQEYVAFEEPVSTVSASKLGSRLTQDVSSTGVMNFIYTKFTPGVEVYHCNSHLKYSGFLFTT